MGNFYDINELKKIDIRLILNHYNIACDDRGFFSIRNEKVASAKIYINTNTYYDWGSQMGGDVITLVAAIENCSNYEAANILSDKFNIESLSKNEQYIRNEQKQVQVERKELILPEKEKSYKIAYSYLMKVRGLSYEIIDYFVNKQNILYEDKNHNLVFLGKDKNGTIKFACKRGTRDIYGKKFKGDCTGSNKEYGINIVTKSENVKVFEAAIDCMSYIDITGDYESNKLILGGLSKNALERFLKENPNIKKITFCLDNDEAAHNILYGDENKMGYIRFYSERGYIVEEQCPKSMGKETIKDYNELLIFKKKNEPNSIAVLNKKSKIR